MSLGGIQDLSNLPRKHETNGSLTWAEFHREWTQLQRDLQERDMAVQARLREIQDIAAEGRDALGDMHTRFTTNEQRVERLAAEVAVLKARSIDWPRIGRWLNPKTVIAIVGSMAGILGWPSIQTWADKWK